MPSSSEIIRWGIVGCGDVSERKSGPAFQQARGSELVAVMRRDAGRAADFARRHGVPRWYSDAADLIGDPEVDAVYIATPPDTHAAYTLQAAAAGKPVYVEKPMARSHAECVEMIRACDEAGVPLFVAYYRRCLPTFLEVEQLLRAGAIGEVRCVDVRICHAPGEGDRRPAELPWRVLPDIAGDGYFFDLGSHQLDLLDYLLGPLTTARGQAVNQAGLYPASDAVTAAFQFESGVVGTGSWCFTAAPGSQVDRLEIIGSQGRITCACFALAQPVVVETEADGVRELPPEVPDPIQLPLVQTVVDELLGRGTCPSTGTSAARASWAMDQIVGGD